jgi:uncharacterized membrane protein (DUF2068 family)
VAIGMTTARDSHRSRMVLRVIAAERFLRGLLLLAAGFYLLTHLSHDFGRLAERLIRQIELDPQQPVLHRFLVRLHDLHRHALKVAGIGALAYGGLELVEGAGLWLDQLWAEYLTVIATSLLIPIEVYELIRHPTLLKAGGIAVNVAIVAFLVWNLRRHLAAQRASTTSRPSRT